MTAKPTSPPPAYFLSLSLENVRSFGEKQTISFARPDGRPAQWTIILGDNGVGKTTVLKALAASMRNENVDEHGRFQTLWRYIDKMWNPLRYKEPSAPITEGSFASFDTVNSVGETLTDIQLEGLKVKKRSGTLTFHVYIKPNQPTDLYRRTTNKLLIAAKLTSSVGAWGKALTCYGYGASRTTGNSNLSESSATIDTCISLFDDRADLLNAEEWFLNIDYSSKLAGENAGQLVRARDLVAGMLKTVLPGVTELRIASTGTPQKPQISLQFLLFDTWVRLRDMSLGYQTLVVWLTDFASKLFIRYPDSENPLEEPAIVLIDEIDLHLHPSWQRKLLRFLSDIFVNTQFIATAHSPLVVQAAGDIEANVVLLKRDGDQTIVHQNPEDVRGWRIDQILNSELFEDTSTLSVQTEEELAQRNALLLKKRLTAKDKADLERLNAKVTAPPIGDTPPERKVESLLARLARNLKEEDLLD